MNKSLSKRVLDENVLRLNEKELWAKKMVTSKKYNTLFFLNKG